ncbi:MAG: 4-alpha-glucanotransferase [Clostridiales bacterium]|jgi:4-alpha-glucanotransferase|nr:4-alpha-glucanotransferase [Clostridiales bacterium]
MKRNRCAGILAHIASLPSNYGIGDLGENSYKFIDFLHESNQQLWQILPLNPTGYSNSPYQSSSVFAGNFLLISPDILIQKKLLNNNFSLPKFNDDFIDYDSVYEFKSQIFRTAFDNFKITEEYIYFCEKNNYWLDDFTLFSAIKNYFIDQRKKINIDFLDNKKNINKDYFYGAVWNTWDENLIKREKNVLNKFKNNLEKEINYQKFLQYEFDFQWRNLKKYANKNNIKIIGDAPIYVAFDSSDVWSNLKLFDIDKNFFPEKIAGVPPDYFSPDGQMWGNPLYNWKNNKLQNYDWWTKRLKKNFELFDFLRIDHFRAFDSYWEIEYGEVSAKNGRWCKGPGKSFFNDISKSLNINLKDLNVIAEDLGIISDSVRELLFECDFMSMKVLQFGFDGSKQNDHLPHNFKNNNLIAYVGTHDNDTTKSWYDKSHEDVKDLVRRYQNISGENICWDMIRLLYSSIADFAIITIQDILCLDSNSRINTPGTNKNNWKFRFKKDIFSENIINNLAYITKLFDRS